MDKNEPKAKEKVSRLLTDCDFLSLIEKVMIHEAGIDDPREPEIHATRPFTLNLTQMVTSSDSRRSRLPRRPIDTLGRVVSRSDSSS